MSESKLIKAARKNKREAQSALYQAYHKHWFMICLRYNGNRADAEDCLQNALVNIFSRLGQFDEVRGSFKDWSSRIVVNENLRFYNQRKRERELIEENVEMVEWDESFTETALSSEQMTKVIQSLPDGYRTVFNLYVMEGYDHDEIAGILNISRGTSKSQLHKARKMLQKQLEVLL